MIEFKPPFISDITDFIDSLDLDGFYLGSKGVLFPADYYPLMGSAQDKFHLD